MDPRSLPAGRDHLDPEDRTTLDRCERLAADGRFAEAKDLVEGLWREANDAHKGLYRGLANALTAVCAQERGQVRGAREIAAATRAMLAPFPAQALGFDLHRLLAAVDARVASGQGAVDLAVQD